MAIRRHRRIGRATRPAGSEAEVSFEDRGGILVVTLSGSLPGPESMPILDRVTERAKGAPSGVVLDLMGVSYVGSFVIGKLLSLGDTCRGVGRGMALANASESVLRIVELLGLTTALGYYPTVEEGIAALKSRG